MRRPRLLLAAIAVLATPLLTAAADPVTVDLADEGYEFEGWGVSLCWWAHQVGDWPEQQLAELLDEIVDPAEGLGLTLFRYNIGGGDAPGHDHLRSGGDVPGFQVGPDAAIDPEADPNQRRVLLGLIERVRRLGREPVLEAWSNSPPHWMTESGCAAGAVDGGPNLPDDRIDDFAAYLADVVRLYRDRYGVTFRTIDPFNEPNSDWWKAGGNQEGCQIPTRQQARVIAAMHEALDQRGLQATTSVAATDGHSIDWTLGNLRALDAETLGRLGQLNTHTYRGTRRVELREFAAAAGKRLWQSESGPMGMKQRRYPGMVEMMGRIALDLNELRPSAWFLWQAVSTSHDWGCFIFDKEASSCERSKSYGLYAQFTRAIRPGDAILPGDDRPNLLVARSSDRSRAIVVVVNDQAEAASREVRFINRKAAPGGLVVTRSGRRELAEPVEGAATIDAGLLRIEAAPHSVTTVLVPLGGAG